MGGTTAGTRATAPTPETRSFRLASSTTAIILGALGLALFVADAPLSYLTHSLRTRSYVGGVLLAVVLIMAVLMVRRLPTNPIGWIFVGVPVGLGFYDDAGRYAALDYRFHDGHLPLGPAAVLVSSDLWIGFFLALPLVVLLFPDGRLSRRWQMVLWAYLALAAIAVAYVFGVTARNMSSQPISVDSAGQLANNPNPSGVAGTLLAAGLLALVVFWVSFVGRQVVSWRGSTGERRQQLKWLMCGGALSVIGLVGTFLSAQYSGTAASLLHIFSFGIVALPISISIAMLKYRLYEIDRLISRTVSYAVVTGLVVGVYVGVVTLTTKALGFSSPVAVAASTLAAVALFNPLRHRLQRVVDRRFNRARYDAEAIVGKFTARLRDAVDLDTVQADLVDVVREAFEPSNVGVWIRDRKSAP